MGPILVEACRYNRWANLHLLDVCTGLPDAQLQLTAPGTYGPIAATLQHLVNSERRYIWRLGGDRGRFTQRHSFPGLAVLRRLAAASGDQLVETAMHIKGDDRVVSKWRSASFGLDSGVILLQALHHGNDHRTHVCTILGAHDLEYGDMDVWAYGEATGAMVRSPAKP